MDQNELQRMIEQYKKDMQRYMPTAAQPASDSTQSQTSNRPTASQPPEEIAVQTPSEQPQEEIGEDRQANNNPLIPQSSLQNSFVPPSVPRSQIILGATSDLTGSGTLIVQAFSGRQSMPMPDVRVSVSSENPQGEDESLVGFFVTDIDGKTPPIQLPTVEAEKSLVPGMKNPYAAYNIRAESNGYYISEIKNVPVFDGQTAVQDIDLVPLPDFYTGNRLTIIQGTGPISLN